VKVAPRLGPQRTGTGTGTATFTASIRGLYGCGESVTDGFDEISIGEELQQGGRECGRSHPRSSDLTRYGRDRIRFAPNTDEDVECVFEVVEHVPGSRESERHCVDHVSRGPVGSGNGGEASVTGNLRRRAQSVADSRIREPFGDVVQSVGQVWRPGHRIASTTASAPMYASSLW
jgi:hypothetical protein